MAGIFLIDSIQRRLRESRRQRLLAQAAAWPQTTAEINRWSIVPVEDESASFSTGHQIEAAFHFKLNGDYFGGYVRSTPMSHNAAERIAAGSPTLTIRYDPSNPDRVAVLAPDNAGKLPFEVLPG
jgi:hypothetical protein